jgi:KUP system potassium uptake protein
MATWQRGVKSITRQEQKLIYGLDDFLHDIESGDYRRSKTTSVFLSSDPAVAPSGLVFLANEFQTVAQRVILLNIDIQETPFVRDPGRFCVTDAGQGVYVARFTYGYCDPLDVPKALAQAFPGDDTFNQYHYFANRYVLEAPKGDHWSVWRKRLFIFMFRNVVPPHRLFRMPADRVVEFGRRMVL